MKKIIYYLYGLVMQFCCLKYMQILPKNKKKKMFLTVYSNQTFYLGNIGDGGDKSLKSTRFFYTI